MLLILADDLGWGDLSGHGNRSLATPALDQLAAEGASFTRFYVQPVCAPTRAEMLTGRYAPRDGVVGVTAGRERLDPTTPTIADAFSATEYVTAAFGKWHNGTQAPYHPLCRGFDSFYGFTSGHWADYFDPMLDHDGRVTRGRGYLPDDLTDEAIRFIRKADGRPFFAWVAFNTPHSPMQVPDRWWERHADQEIHQRGSLPDREDLLHTRAALAMVENLDENVGRLMQTLGELGIEDETVVLFLTDNGPNGHRFNGGLRGIKGSTDEGGVRSPLFVRCSGTIPPGLTINAPAAAIDLPATLAELTGVSLIDGPPRDGVSLAPLLRGETNELPERVLFSHWNNRIAARRGDLVLDHQGKLYDLRGDPYQKHDLSSDRPEEAQALADAVSAWRETVLGDEAIKPAPLTVGHPSMLVTQLPARDATTRGTIKRSNRYFNATYFSNWASTEDAIVWDTEVVQAGRFRATAYYTCGPANVGSTIELRFGDASTTTTVATAFDPPLTASTNDRYPRAEGDMKRFAELQLGTIDLTEGRGELVLQAMQVANHQVMDFRLLVLERVEER